MPGLAWVALGVVTVTFIDQASKAVLLNRLTPDRSIRIARGVRLRHVVNARWWAHGVRSPVWLVLLWGVAVATSLLLLEPGGVVGEGVARAGVAVAIGGATANLVDRLARGRIVDFIEIGPWPVFNLADAGIVAGIGLVFLAPLV
jgi:signal peptidase II